MKKLSFAVALIALTACQERLTSPMAQDALAAPTHREALFYPISDPPPPPLDTGVAVVGEGIAFQLRATYLLNPPGTNGFLTFKGVQPEGTVASPDARLSFNKGTVSGRGSLTVTGPTGTLTIDLASVSSSSFFVHCSKGCFDIHVASATRTSGGVSYPVEGGVRLAPASTATEGDGDTYVP